MNPETNVPVAQGITPAVAVENGDAARMCVPPEAIPNLDDLVIEDGKPVESIFMEKQQRLFTEPLYASWSGPGEGRTFLALANVGLFYAAHEPPLVPEALLAADVQLGEDVWDKENRSYFTWLRGKPPDVVIEVVSDRRGGEEGLKLREYARAKVDYYVIFDPQNLLEHGVLRSFTLHGGRAEPLSEHWFPAVNLGLTLWQGTYAGVTAQWLRWCDRQGQVIPTGQERAEQERQRRERLEAQLCALGIEPEA